MSSHLLLPDLSQAYLGPNACKPPWICVPHSGGFGAHPNRHSCVAFEEAQEASLSCLSKRERNLAGVGYVS
ncbi:hypothetical protein AOLI_G00048900 [Acnodon oligacanthus]